MCILENDFGAVNVDAMLVQEVLGPGCDVETISGGCDCDTHQRRMRTKLIAMAMRGFDRVVVEPSGIFDVDEFFDVLRDDPLDRWYQLGSVIAIVDALLPETLSPQAEYLLASETHERGLRAVEPCPAGSARPVRRRRCPLGACTGSRKIFPPLCAGGDHSPRTGTL
ncbi:MAG: GTP-binding protein [Faecalibacterium prausnitzii]